MRKFQNFYGGEEVAGLSGETFESMNPATGDKWGEFALSAEADVDAAVRSANAAFEGEWGRLSATKRGRLMMRLGDLMAKNADLLAALDTAQNGRILHEVTSQVRATSEWMFYYGGLADKIEGSVIPLDQTSVLNYTVRQPMGVVGIIVPWNSPLFLTVMSVAPALAAGNTVVIKPSEVTSASAIEFAKLAIEAGMPPGVINVVTGMRYTGEALVANSGVKKISFTGSDAAGRAIASRASQRLVSTTLELGGKSPNIIFDDVNLDQAESGVLAGIFAGVGQSCIAGSRVYIQDSIYDEMVERLVKRAKSIRLGDPLNRETQMGPVSTTAQLRKNQEMAAFAVKEGAEILCGGDLAKVSGLERGLFFQPTIIHQARADSHIMQDEVFGPVLTVTPFSDFEQVAKMANDTRFGLASGIWTRDIKRAHLLARRINAGTVWINTYRAMTYNSPFGGMKDSGLGRQNGIEAVNQFLQTKSVWVELSDEISDPFVMKT